MSCIVVLKEKIGHSVFFLLFARVAQFEGGGGAVGVIQNNLMSLGGQEENVSSKKNPPTPLDFINERSHKRFHRFFRHSLSGHNKPANRIKYMPKNF